MTRGASGPSPSTVRWHLLTGEYPPRAGGVSDYTRLVATGLAAAGEEVHVWAPASSDVRSGAEGSGVTVHRLVDHFGPRGLGQLAAGLQRMPGHNRLLVQYVPHAFGYRAMNLLFCMWVAARRREQVWIMFHEAVVSFGEGRRRNNLFAAATHAMAALLLQRADRVMLSIPGWQRYLERLTCRRLNWEWSPIPSNLPTEAPSAEVDRLRRRFLSGSPEESRVRVVGHFGTYGFHIAPLVEALVPAVLGGHEDRRVLLLGRGSVQARRRIASAHPELAARLIATGPLSATQLVCHLASCDLMLQPYPDGLSARRSSLMAALALGVPVVSNRGHLTEPFWSECSAVRVEAAATEEALSSSVDRLLARPGELQRLGLRAAEVYRQHFALERTVDRLLSREHERRPLASTKLSWVKGS